MALAKHACGAPRRSGVRHFLPRPGRSIVVALGVLVAYSTFPVSFSGAAPEEGVGNAEKSADRVAIDPNKAGQRQADEKKQAEQQKAAQGFLIRVNVPIVDDVDTRVRRAVTRLINNLKREGPRPVLVVELWPGQVEGGLGSDFSRAYS